MNWGDILAGVNVTPESWEGGVIDYGEPLCWRIHPYTIMLIEDVPKYAAQGQPIFPPKGWAGKTDAELWREVFGSYTFTELWVDGPSTGLVVYQDGRCGLMANGAVPRGGVNELCPAMVQPAALILALQNAQVLARRLQ